MNSSVLPSSGLGTQAAVFPFYVGPGSERTWALMANTAPLKPFLQSVTSPLMLFEFMILKVDFSPKNNVDPSGST